MPRWVLQDFGPFMSILTKYPVYKTLNPTVGTNQSDPTNCEHKKSLLLDICWVFHEKRLLQICKILQIMFLILKNIDNKMLENTIIF